MEEHYFRDAEAFRLDAPGFFPFVGKDAQHAVLTEAAEPGKELEGPE